MANFSWNGAAGDYLDPAQWTPADVPLYGSDTVATISTGTVALSGAEPNGITLVLGSQPSVAQVKPTLVLSNAALGPDLTLDALGYSTLVLDGYGTNYGTVAVGAPGVPTSVTIQSNGFGQLNQDGTLTVGPFALLEFAAGTLLDNEGLTELTSGYVVAQGTISGNGTIALAAPGSRATVNAAVDAGQTFLMQQGTLDVRQAGSFGGTLAGFGSSAATVTFRDIQFDAATYVQDGTGERLELTSNGAAVGEIPLADTPDTQYAVIKRGGLTSITPTEVFTDSSIPSSIAGTDTVTIRNATVDGQAVALGSPGSYVRPGLANLILDNATLGPDLALTVASTAATGRQDGTLTVQGNSTTYGQINLATSADVQPSGRGNFLTINIEPGAQLDQEGTLSVISSAESILLITGPGTLNNNGQIFIGPGSLATIDPNTIGSGTITVDHASVSLFSAAGTQTLDLLGGTVTTSTALQAVIKDWDSDGRLLFRSPVSSVQFNQTSDAGGDLQLFDGTNQVGDLHLLGTYATSDFTLSRPVQGTYITASGKAPPSA